MCKCARGTRMFNGFSPIFNSDSKVLILGSFPSVKSREISFYYGNKQNRFWKMITQILGEEMPDSVESKKEILLKYKIALWDIVKTCEIKGSMDTDLKCLEAVDLSIITKKAKLEKIICNGTKAYEIFKKNYPDLHAVCLPSTSPANARFDISKWQQELKMLL